MNTITTLALTFAAALAVSACSGGGGGSGGGDFTGTLFTERGKVGWDINGDGTAPILAGFADEGRSFDANADGVWIASSADEIYGMQLDGSNLRGPFPAPANTVELDFATIAGTDVWFANSGSAEGPVVFDTVAETAVALAPDPEFLDRFNGIDSDDDAVYVLYGNSFALVKYDRASRARDIGVPLGENPADPTGPRGEFAGHGRLGVDQSFVWVFDTTVYKLHKIEKADLSIVSTVDLNALIPPDSDFVNINMVVGDERVYIANRTRGFTDGSDIIAVDKNSGEASVVWSTDGVISSGLAVNGDTLIVDTTFQVFIVDGQSGDEIGEVAALLDGDPTIWVP